MSGIQPNMSLIYIVLNKELKVERMINNYTIFQFLADAGGSMGEYEIKDNTCNFFQAYDS